MRMEIKEKREFSINNKEHFERKQDSFLWLKTLSHYKNRHIRLHYENNVLIKRRINNVHVKNYKSNRIELRNFRKENISHYLDS